MSFYVSRSERSTYAIKNIEAFFSTNSVSTGTLGYINATPQIIKQTNFITDTTQWIEVQGCFTAIGGEQFVTIGNFNSNANTDTLFIGTDNPIPSYGDFSYYYIDDIIFIDQSTVGVNELVNENSFEVYPNPANGIINISSFYDFNKIELFSITGQVLLSETNTEKTYQLQLQTFEEGIYFMKITRP